MLPRLLTAVLSTVVAASFLGCASPTGAQRLDTTNASISDIGSQLDQGAERLDAVLTSMDALDTNEDLDRAFRDFQRAVSNLEQTAERVRSRRIALEARAAEHIAQWRRESAQLTSDSAQEISAQRRQEFERSVATVTAKLADLRSQYDPFVSKLRDLQLVLANDLTRPGVDLTRPLRATIAEQSKGLREASANARQALDTARADFAR
jgi:chromosome segregation ATPase